MLNLTSEVKFRPSGKKVYPCRSCVSVNLGNGLLNSIAVKQSHHRPRVAQRVPESWGSQILWQRHRIVVRLSALSTGRLYPQEMLLVLISVRSWVDPRATVRSEGFYVNEKFQWHQLGSNQRQHNTLTTVLPRSPLRIGWWGEYLVLGGTSWQGIGEDYITRSSVMCTSHKSLSLDR